ncbi:MAG: GIY-YIG nuclease family protein [Chitinophagaceae bacterium]|nr:MAG: GIY-YIG nuclease family protein [Chitinophagaceae bacterium]
MPFYVYILQSEKDGTFYKGVTSDFEARLRTHNLGGNVSTKSRRPWKMIYLHAFDSQSEALKEERRLKRCNKNYLRVRKAWTNFYL